MAAIESVAVTSPEPEAVDAFHAAAFDLRSQVASRASDSPSSGFRGFALSLVVGQPGTVDSLYGTAIDNGAGALKPPSKSLWGYGAALRAPDGTVWQIATSSKKDTGPATRRIDEIVLLLGVDDVLATKKFYMDKGLPVGKSYGRKYVEFETPDKHVKLALYSRKGLAKNVGVDPEGTGSHRLVVTGDAGTFTDPDGFEWESAA